MNSVDTVRKLEQQTGKKIQSTNLTVQQFHCGLLVDITTVYCYMASPESAKCLKYLGDLFLNTSSQFQWTVFILFTKNSTILFELSTNSSSN